MAVKVGIPRALLYYIYYPAWEAFFSSLGVETVLSGESTKATLDQGVRSVTDEACLPVKLFIGHVIELRNRGVKIVFVPRVISVVKKEYLCPKFLGLPEMVRFSVPGVELVEMDIDASKGKTLEKSWLELGARFSRKPWVIRKALRNAQNAQQNYEYRLQQGLTPLDVLSGKNVLENEPAAKIRLALLGHAYNLNDKLLSLNLIEMLRERGTEVVTTEMICSASKKQGASSLQKDVFWTFGREMIGTAFYLLEHNAVDGVILVASFGCGPDSLLCEMVERRYRRDKNVPVLLLTLDEQTGEAGIITRVEAFVEMINRRMAI